MDQILYAIANLYFEKKIQIAFIFLNTGLIYEKHYSHTFNFKINKAKKKLNAIEYFRIKKILMKALSFQYSQCRIYQAGHFYKMKNVKCKNGQIIRDIKRKYIK